MTYSTLSRISKDKRCWAKAVSDEYTHIHFIVLQLLWTSLATDILLWSSSHCFFAFFCLPLDTNWLRGESSFCPEQLCTPSHGTFSHRHPISQLILKNIHTYTTRIAQRWSSILFTRFQQGLLAETGWWKEIFFCDSKLEKLFGRTEIKMPHMHRSVSQSLLNHLAFSSKVTWMCLI